MSGEPFPAPVPAPFGPDDPFGPPSASLVPDLPHHRVRPDVARTARVPLLRRDGRAQPPGGGPRASNGDASPSFARCARTRSTTARSVIHANAPGGRLDKHGAELDLGTGGKATMTLRTSNGEIHVRRSK